ncbi:MAG: hypothetical protein PHV60_04860 [bacterium]|nr:hypothetical protein [bacterium]
MNNPENLFNIAIGVAIFIYALMYRYGYFRGKQNSRFRKIINMDEFLFPNLNEEIAHRADILSFWVCSFMAVLIVLNGIESALTSIIPNISMIFIVISFPGVLILRIIYILVKKNKSKNTGK